MHGDRRRRRAGLHRLARRHRDAAFVRGHGLQSRGLALGDRPRDCRSRGGTRPGAGRRLRGCPARARRRRDDRGQDRDRHLAAGRGSRRSDRHAPPRREPARDPRHRGRVRRHRTRDAALAGRRATRRRAARLRARCALRQGPYQPIARLATPRLPATAQAGAYRDPAGELHILTTRPGLLALFAPGKWGDPRYVSAGAPTCSSSPGRADPAERRSPPSCTAPSRSARRRPLYASVLGPNGRRVLLTRQGSRLGSWLRGTATTTLQALQPGLRGWRLRVRVAARRDSWPASATCSGSSRSTRTRRRSTLSTPFTAPR